MTPTPTTPTLEAALYAMLTADPAVAAVVADRVYPVAVEKPAVPFIVYEVTGGSDSFTRDGYDGLLERRVVVNVVAVSYQKAVELAAAVKAAMPVWGAAAAGVEFRLLARTGERDYLAADQGKVTPVGRQLSFTIKYVIAPQQEQTP